MTTSLQAYDLEKYAQRLIKTKNTRKQGHRILSALDAASSHADLLLAQHLISALHNLEGHVSRSALSAAIVSQVVLLYARATITVSARKLFQLDNLMDETQLARHKQIKTLRDEAVAHFDRKTTFQGVLWAKESLVYLSDDRVGVVSARISSNHAVVRTLAEQLDFATEAMERIARQKRSDAHKALYELMEDEREGIALAALPIDIRALFETAEHYDDFIGASRGGGQLHQLYRAAPADEKAEAS